MASQPIRTTSELVDVLGRSFLKEWLDLGDSAISLWISRNYVPPAWHLRLFLELKRRRLKFDCEALFGISEAEARVVEPARFPAPTIGRPAA